MNRECFQNKWNEIWVFTKNFHCTACLTKVVHCFNSQSFEDWDITFKILLNNRIQGIVISVDFVDAKVLYDY